MALLSMASAHLTQATSTTSKHDKYLHSLSMRLLISQKNATLGIALSQMKSYSNIHNCEGHILGTFEAIYYQ